MKHRNYGIVTLLVLLLLFLISCGNNSDQKCLPLDEYNNLVQDLENIRGMYEDCIADLATQDSLAKINYDKVVGQLRASRKHRNRLESRLVNITTEIEAIYNSPDSLFNNLGESREFFRQTLYNKFGKKQ